MKLRRDIVASFALGALAFTGTTLSSGANYTATSTNPRQVFTAAVDWIAPTVVAAVPSGALRATVTLSATVTDASSIDLVRIQRSPANAATWSDVCTDTSAPYTCSFDTTAVADGRYDFRALAVDSAANSGTSATVPGRLVDNHGPAIDLADPGADVRATITLSATADDGAGSGVASVRIERSPVDAATWTTVCTDTTAPYSCSLDTTTLADDFFDLRAVASDAAGNVTTSAVQTIGVDNALPTVLLTDPGASLSGTVTLDASADDADSGISTVTIQRAAAGGSSWTNICVEPTLPWSCRWATTGVADGLYDLRAVAVDAAGNSRTSATVASRRVDNTVSSVSLEDPGSLLRGTVTLNANANSTGGVASVLIQRSPAGKATWTGVCTDTSTPYSCSLDTTPLADGAYDLRAIMTTTAGAKITSATVAARTVDNSVVRGSDVQATNKSGGKTGQIEPGDSFALSYSVAMRPATLVPGWSGAGATSVFVRITDAGGVETLRLTTDAAGTGATGLGSVATGGNFIKNNKAIVFAATATLGSATGGGTVVTITLGAPSSGAGNTRTQTAATALKWTPSATATSATGVAVSTAVATETGVADRDF